MNASTELNYADDRFYIYDCSGKVVGNVKGYRTFRGANAQQNTRGTKAYREIWRAYDTRENKKDNFLSKIAQGAFFRAVY